MAHWAFCGSPDVELTTTDFEESQGGVTIKVEGVPAVRCHLCQEGGEPAVTIAMAKALQTAVDLIFGEAPNSERVLKATATPEAAR